MTCNVDAVNVSVDLLEKDSRLRLNDSNAKTSITLHSTANERSTAINERKWLSNPQNTRIASWHYCVDEERAVNAIPDEETAYHCGNSIGNKSSISVEICESGDRKKTLDVAALLVACKMREYGFGLDKVVTHKSWNGKNCPRILLDSNFVVDGMDLEYFLRLVGDKLCDMEKTEKMDAVAMSVKSKLGLMDNTMEYLKSYEWGYELLKRIDEAVDVDRK